MTQFMENRLSWLIVTSVLLILINGLNFVILGTGTQVENDAIFYTIEELKESDDAHWDYLWETKYLPLVESGQLLDFEARRLCNLEVYGDNPYYDPIPYGSDYEEDYISSAMNESFFEIAPNQYVRKSEIRFSDMPEWASFIFTIVNVVLGLILMIIALSFAYDVIKALPFT